MNIHPTNDQLIELFTAFLIAQGAKEEWFHAVPDPQEVFTTETPDMWIGEAFMWYSTPSGYAYWAELDALWQKELAKPTAN